MPASSSILNHRQHQHQQGVCGQRSHVSTWSTQSAIALAQHSDQSDSCRRPSALAVEHVSCSSRSLVLQELAVAEGKTFVAPYDDPLTIAGQGTVGTEILRQISTAQLSRLHAIFVPVGGGGLIAGIAAYVKALYPQVRPVQEAVPCCPDRARLHV